MEKEEKKEEEEDGSTNGHENIKYLLSCVFQIKTVNSTSWILRYPTYADRSFSVPGLPATSSLGFIYAEHATLHFTTDFFEPRF